MKNHLFFSVLLFIPSHFLVLAYFQNIRVQQIIQTRGSDERPYKYTNQFHKRPERKEDGKEEGDEKELIYELLIYQKKKELLDLLPSLDAFTASLLIKDSDFFSKDENVQRGNIHEGGLMNDWLFSDDEWL